MAKTTKKEPGPVILKGPAKVDVEFPDPGIRFEEDTGKPHSLAGSNTWVEVMSLELAEPAHRGAQVSVSGHIGDHAAGLGVSYQLAIIECRVIFHFGAYREEVFRGFLGGIVNSHLFWTDQPIRAARITAEARLLVDGQPGSSIADMPDATASAWGSVFYR